MAAKKNSVREHTPPEPETMDVTCVVHTLQNGPDRAQKVHPVSEVTQAVEALDGKALKVKLGVGGKELGTGTLEIVGSQVVATCTVPRILKTLLLQKTLAFSYDSESTQAQDGTRHMSDISLKELFVIRLPESSELDPQEIKFKD